MTNTTSHTDPRYPEQGSALVFFAILLSALFVMLVLGFGVVGATMIRTTQESALSTVSENAMNPAFSLKVKNSSDPGSEIARNAVRELRASGFSDKIEVWFFELPESEVTPDKRIFAFEVVLTSPFAVPFGGAVDINTLDISSSIVVFAMPYAEFSSWRPSTARNGVFSAQAHSTALTFEAKALASMPEKLQQALTANQQSLS